MYPVIPNTSKGKAIRMGNKKAIYESNNSILNTGQIITALSEKSGSAEKGLERNTR
jgi:hypothetical protein